MPEVAGSDVFGRSGVFAGVNRQIRAVLDDNIAVRCADALLVQS